MSDMQYEIAPGIAVFIDDADFQLVSRASSWWLTNSGYARGYFPRTPESAPFTAFMHRVILGLTPDDMRDGDHINGIRIDNRRSNLRICTHRENCWNTAISSRNTSGYKGVSLDKRCNKWHARIRVFGKIDSLGYFDTPEAAHAAYCEAAKKYFGEFAKV